MLKINNLTKKYDENIGNFEINFEVKEGQAYAILGPNGAGKTTLIRQILGFIKPTDGNVTINNVDTWKHREQVMDDIGYVAGEIALYDDLKGIDYLKIVSKIKKDVEWDYVEKLIQYFDIDTKRKIKKMSKGMKQKIAIITAVMNKPKILILDEPTSGLDPIMKEEFNILINKLKQENGTTVLICSHIFEEVIKIADNVGFIKNGKLVEEKSLQNEDITSLENSFYEIYKRKDIL